jgi:hypothetical protein
MKSQLNQWFKWLIANLPPVVLTRGQCPPSIAANHVLGPGTGPICDGNKRFADNAVAKAHAFALCSTLDKAKLGREEAAFLQGVKIILAKKDTAAQTRSMDSHELTENLRQNLSVDWSESESVRAKLRLMVKRILRKYKYPPDLQDSAVELVLQQMQAIGEDWAL